jgi:hypothetical protein
MRSSLEGSLEVASDKGTTHTSATIKELVQLLKQSFSLYTAVMVGVFLIQITGLSPFSVTKTKHIY